MLFHSIVSFSDIFYNAGHEQESVRYRRIKGGILETQVFQGEERVVRLISTDPRMYLIRSYNPYTGYKPV